jgi:hypothetical protein
MLLNKQKKAVHGLDTTQENLDALSSTISEETRNRWLAEEAASIQGEKGFQIYDVDVEKGLFPIIFVFSALIVFTICPAPSQAAIHFQLVKSESENDLLSGSIAWLASGLDIELAQCIYYL